MTTYTTQSRSSGRIWRSRSHNVVPTAAAIKMDLQWRWNKRFGQVDVNNSKRFEGILRNSSSTSSLSMKWNHDRKEAGQTNDIKDMRRSLRTRWNILRIENQVQISECNERENSWREDARAKRRLKEQQEEKFQKLEISIWGTEATG